MAAKKCQSAKGRVFDSIYYYAARKPCNHTYQSAIEPVLLSRTTVETQMNKHYADVFQSVGKPPTSWG